ncbi:hypothetical protein Y032_0303g1900 [Ancylostoma ceylanicum]|uniref:MGAT4 conserved region domain-containing protein n=1 Tax=Ancylostoma ceylanicum TaxID=53326 RepID=A0A016S3G1_9BILA|nr:hypothetical protein Y032_0303g1900 [Ancylostoma ceylanicum]
MEEHESAIKCNSQNEFNITTLLHRMESWKQNLSNHSAENFMPTLFGRGIFDFFPHLASVNLTDLAPVMLTPTIQRWKRLVFGIPVVMRNTNYIEETLASLFKHLTPSASDQVLFVVMFATPNTNTAAFKKLSYSLISNYANEIEEGLLEVAVIPSKWYESQPAFITPTFNDSSQRMQWRLKQNLDYFYLMNYGRQKAEYYMQLEDDVATTPKYAQTVLNYLQLKEGRPWFSMHFSTLGFIGKLFRSEDVKIITNAILSYYKYKPVDWIFLDVEYSITCSPEYRKEQCIRARDASRVMVSPPQFQHIGKLSSLGGKKQKLKERFFDKSSQKMTRSNPPAKVTSSMPTYYPYTAELGYQKFAFMWFTKASTGDNVTIEFHNPVKVLGVQMISGINPAPLDMFAHDTKLYAQVTKYGVQELMAHPVVIILDIN